MSIIPRQMLCPESKKSIKFPYSMIATRIVVHNTANDASANNEISYMNSNNNKISFHFAIDNKEVVQGLPLNVNGWHAGDGNGKGNRDGIGIEICYSLSGGQRFIDSEKLAAKFIAQILNERGWGIDKVTKHQDYSGKYCPHRTLDMSWNRFLDMVREEMGASPEPTPTPIPSGNTYDVVVTLKGYYTSANAMSGIDPRSVVNPGTYYVYNKSGDAVNVTKTKGTPGSWINTKLNGTNPTPAPSPSGEFNIGDEVVINGQLFGNSAGGNPGNTVRDKRTNITRYAFGAKYPYNTTGDLGWVGVSSLSRPGPEPAPINTIKEGSIVKVKQGAKTYTGGGVASFVYNGKYRVDELKGERAVLDMKGICTPINIKDLILL